MATFRGDDRDDFYRGTAEADFIYGAGGNDLLIGQGGTDRLFGEDGDDTLRGGDAADLAYGGAGFDIINGDAGDDRLFGDAGDDILRGGTGIDRYDGGDGFDRISFFLADATQGVVADLRNGRILNDGYGNSDRMTSIEALGLGTVFADRFFGNDVKNFLFGDDGDTAFGFGGDDQIDFYGVAGARIDGGDGNDTFHVIGIDVTLNADGVFEFSDAGRGAIVDLARGEVRDDGFGGRARLLGIENVVGTVRDDSITGDDGGNQLVGLDGDDRLYGNGGFDVINGGLGVDRLVGGAGADRFDFRGFENGFFFDPTTGMSVERPAPGDSGATIETADRIFDFSQTDVSADNPGRTGDLISLLPVDANTGEAGDQAFTFLGTAAFTGAAGELRYVVGRNVTYVYLEVNGEEGADMVIRLDGVVNLTANDFVL